MSPGRISTVSSRNVWSPTAPSRIPAGPSSTTFPARRSSGGGWPAAATVIRDPSISTHTSVTGASRGCSTRISLTSASTAAGPRVEARRGAHGVAHERGERGGGDALAGHVAEEHEVAAAVGGHDVVEVAADLGALLAGLVGRGAAPAGQLRQALGQQAGLERVRDADLRLVQARVLDRGRGAQREILREREVVVAEAAAAVGGDQRERAERLLSPTRIGTTITERMPIARIASSCSGSVDRLLEHLVGDVAEQLGRAAAQDRGHAGRGVRVRRVAAAQILGHRDLGRVGVGERDLLDAALAVRQVDGAPVRQPRHGELRDALQRLLVVERGGEQLPGLGEEALAQLGLLGVRDVLDDVDREVAPLILEQRRLGQQPVGAPGLAVDAAREQRGRGLAGHEAAAGEVLDLDRRAVLLGDREAGRELAGARGGDVVGRRRGRAAAPRRRWRRSSGPASSWTVTASASEPRTPSRRARVERRSVTSRALASTSATRPARISRNARSSAS